MASGRIHPGSRQWVDAMRRLSETTDATVDMSMGRKVSRDAAIPHRMGTAALDTRLRGEGGGGGSEDLTIAVVRMERQEVFYSISGGVPPYLWAEGSWADPIPLAEPGIVSVDYGGWWQVDPWVEDATGKRVVIDVFVAPPRPETWAVVRSDGLPVVNGLFTAVAFTADADAGSPRNRCLMVGPPNMHVFFAENGLTIAGQGGPNTQPELPAPDANSGASRFYAFNDPTGEVFGFEATYPSDLPWTDIVPRAGITLTRNADGRWQLRAAHGHLMGVFLSVLDSFGDVGQGQTAWAEGDLLRVFTEGTGNMFNVHWSGSAWANGAAPQPPAADEPEPDPEP
jgi:hypothetical protein